MTTTRSHTSSCVDSRREVVELLRVRRKTAEALDFLSRRGEFGLATRAQSLGARKSCARDPSRRIPTPRPHDCRTPKLHGSISASSSWSQVAGVGQCSPHRRPRDGCAEPTALSRNGPQGALALGKARDRIVSGMLAGRMRQVLANERPMAGE